MLCSIGAFALAPGCAAQTRQTILTQTVDRAEWAMGPVADLRFGRVAVVAAPDGPRLEVRRLRDAIPTAPELRIEGVTPEFTGNDLVVGDFARSNRSTLGGYFNTFMRAPSDGSATVGRTTDGRRALTLSCDRADTGFCGLWIQLYDFEASPNRRSYLDATPFSTLSFWIRGHRGGERLVLKLADARWELKEDALAIGDLGEFLASGQVDTTWQQAVVPLDRFPPRIDRATLALIVWEAVSPGRTEVDLGPVAFSLRPTGLPSLPEPWSEPLPSRPEHLATWLWNTHELLADTTHRDTLLDALAREGFDRVFLQLPDAPGQRAVPGEITIDASTLRPLMAAFARRGMEVYALDGYARYALPEYHAGVLRTVDHVIGYNSESDPSERFIGIRYDIEPYILPAFHGPHRQQLLRRLLDLTARSAERAHAAGLAYGVDIPFWYDAPDEATSERVMVEWNGVRKAVSEHLIDLVDDVSIMDYRTIAYGADGTIRHATGELAYATSQDKPVFIGLETSDLPDEVLLEFRGEPERGLPATWPVGSVVVLAQHEDSIRIYLVPEGGAGDAATSRSMASWFDDQGIDRQAFWWWPVTRRVDVPASKITFARHGSHRLREVMDGTRTELGRFPSFAGFALHFAESYLALVGNVPRPEGSDVQQESPEP
ncbi:MAG: hypothetical protein OER90_15745 [Gemmatimonadota bacterium]|nr:hypothetical protein [Gemmatimonadota bacterium]